MADEDMSSAQNPSKAVFNQCFALKVLFRPPCAYDGFISQSISVWRQFSQSTWIIGYFNLNNNVALGHNIRSVEVLAAVMPRGAKTLFLNAQPAICRMLISGALMVVALSSVLAAEPFVPESDLDVLEQVPSSADPQLTALRRASEASPEALEPAVALAAHYIRLARAEGDPRFYGYAEATLAPWWTTAQPPVDVLVLRAVVRQARHEFDSALTDLVQVNERQPGNAQAWLSRSVIHRVQGDYAEALESCLPLFRLVNRLMATACSASAAALSGQAAASYELLASEVQRRPTRNEGEALWFSGLLADMAIALSDVEKAEAHLKSALALDPDNPSMLSRYADLLLDEGRDPEVLELLATAPERDSILLRQAIAKHRLGAPDADALATRLEEGFRGTRARGDSPHGRGEARLALELRSNPTQALDFALANWEVQREPWDARLVLQAAFAADQPAAAASVLAHLERNGTEHAWLEPLAAKLREAIP